MNKINDINGNSKMAAVALSLARKNIIWTTDILDMQRK